MGMFSPPSKAMAQDLKVLVLGALNGKPQAKVKVEAYCVGTPRNFWGKPAFTNDNGIATISYACNDNQKIQFLINPPGKKEQCGGSEELASQDIIIKGIVSNPDIYGSVYCPTKISKKLKPVPGEVIMFIKKPTWWQYHVAG
jgi:hypothetical protein